MYHKLAGFGTELTQGFLLPEVEQQMASHRPHQGATVPKASQVTLALEIGTPTSILSPFLALRTQ